MKSSSKGEGYKLLSQKVYEILKKEIIHGILEPGSSVSENKLATKLKVSRTPIREAMGKLIEERLVKTSPNKKMTISDVSITDIKEVLMIRGALEGLSASIASKRISDQEIDRLEKIVKQMHICVDEDNLSTYFKADDEFHDLILKVCDNKWIVKIRRNLSNIIYRYRFKSLSVPGRLKHSLEEHKAILESLKRHDPEEADKLSKLHMENTIINILRNVL